MAEIVADLWLWRLGGAEADSLSEDERTRAARFVFARDRQRFIAGRAMLRHILGTCLGLEARDIVFRHGPFGRPEVDGIAFNLSHTQDLAALIVARDPRLALGVDIEALRPIGPEVAEAHFAEAEIAALRSLPPEEREAAFYRCWTRKEAFLKALGTGLSTDLSSFHVTLGPSDPPRLLSCAGGDAADWRIFDIAPAPGIAGAVAIRNHGRPVRLRQRCFA